MDAPTARLTTGITLAVGFVTAGAQVTLLRELLVACGGNELAAGLALTCWMFGTAVGSAAGGVAVRPGGALDRMASPLAGIGLCSLSLALPLSMWTVEWARRFLGPPGGEVVALHQSLAICAATLAVPCVLLGALFPLLCRMTARAGARMAGARVFGWEALGFGVGGLLFGLVLAGRVPAPQAMVGLAMVALGAVPGLWSGRRRLAWGGIAVVLVGVSTAALVPRLQRSTLLGREALASRDTVHARVEVLQGAGQHDVYMDGLWAFSYPDPEIAEWTAHPPLLIHPEPRRVLLLGGAVSGVLDGVLAHPSVSRVDVVELDPQLVTLAQEALPAVASDALADPRVSLHLTDGRAFVRRAAGPYDVILLALPDPRNAQLNRFYTEEFYGLCSRLLAEDGLLATGVSGSADMLGPTQAEYVASVRSTLMARFDHVLALPGARVTFVASQGELTLEPDQMAARLEQRGMQPLHVRPFDLPFSLGPFRVDYLQQVLDGADLGQVNRDLRPLCFYQDTVLWASVQAPGLAAVLGKVEQLGLAWLLALLLAGAGVHAVVARRGPRIARNTAIPASVAAMGATGIVAEVALILGYQVAYGHLFARIGVIVAAYMLGLGAGAFLMVRGTLVTGRRTLLVVQVAAAAGCSVLAILASWVGVASLPALAEPVFVVFMGLVGLAAGLHFPCAVQLRRDRGTVGGLYAWDLAGAAVGSLAASAILLPVLGVAAVLWALAALNMGAVVVLLATTGRRKMQHQTDVSDH